jgi:hypothetical protein
VHRVRIVAFAVVLMLGIFVVGHRVERGIDGFLHGPVPPRRLPGFQVPAGFGFPVSSAAPETP